MIIEMSEDQAAIIKDNVEQVALCYFCDAKGEFTKPSGVDIYSKPKKWALIFGGTPRKRKRFFICNGCAKSINAWCQQAKS